MRQLTAAGGIVSGDSPLGSGFYYVDHFADVLHRRNLAHLETDTEFVFYSGDEVDMLKAVPVLYIICCCACFDLDLVIVKYVSENLV